MCNFSASMTSSDCQTKINLNLSPYDVRSIACIDVNRKKQVALIWGSVFNKITIYIVELKEGRLVLKDNYTNFDKYQFSKLIKWHPVDQEIVISLVLFSLPDLNIGPSLDIGTTILSLLLINTTTRSNFTLNVSGFHNN
jgi:hypothetical protein